MMGFIFFEPTIETGSMKFRSSRREEKQECIYGGAICATGEENCADGAIGMH